MTRKSSRKLVYTLASQSSLQGHSLGVNSLAVDPSPPPPDSLLASDPANDTTPESVSGTTPSEINGILYSAGRDGTIVAWQLRDMDLATTRYPPAGSPPSEPPASSSSFSVAAAPPPPPPSRPVPSASTSSFTASHRPPSSSVNSYPRSIASTDPSDPMSRALRPSLAAYLSSNKTLQHPDAPTIPPIPQTKSQKTSHIHGLTTYSVAGQIHTNWVNDILLINNNQSVVSCSSDLTVKLWNPHTDTQTTVGQHRDYVKCLATPTNALNPALVYSAGLDRCISCWDVSRAGSASSQVFSLNVGHNDKGSVYSLAISGSGPQLSGSNGSVIAAGGPDAIVRLWDARTAAATAKPIASFTGHTDNIRSLLVSEHGDWVLSASSDSTIRLWSVTAGRMLHTFDMHQDSVWALYSRHPSLQVFYSSDRSGVIAKTDVRNVTADIDEEAVCAVVANEHNGVSSLVSAGPYLWAATSNSRIHRWVDFDTMPYAFHNQVYVETKEEDEEKQEDEGTSTPAITTHFLSTDGGPTLRFNQKSDISLLAQQASLAPPPTEILDTVSIATSATGATITTVNAAATTAGDNDSDSLAMTSTEHITVEPIHVNPIETLQGKIGLIKHHMLSDRRRVITIDTAGEIVLWDLLRCVRVQSFGTGLDLDSVADHLNNPEASGGSASTSTSNWCQVTTRSGELFVTLHEDSCFDAEVYADEIWPELGGDAAVKKHSASNPTLASLPPHHTINLGHWALRNLLSNLITVEIAQDKEYRRDLELGRERQNSTSSNGRLQQLGRTGSQELGAPISHLNTNSSSTTTGGINVSLSNTPYTYATATNGSTASSANGTAVVVTKSTSNSAAAGGKSHPGLMGRLRSSFGKNKKDKSKDSKCTDDDEHATLSTGGTSAGSAVSGGSSSGTANGSSSSGDFSEETVLRDVLNDIHAKYIELSNAAAVEAAASVREEDETPALESKNPFLDSVTPSKPKSKPLATLITPSPPTETPILRIPGATKIMISQLMPGSEGLVDLYRGCVLSMNQPQDATRLEAVVPRWIADSILRNHYTKKTVVKVGLVLMPCSEAEQAAEGINPLPRITCSDQPYPPPALSGNYYYPNGLPNSGTGGGPGVGSAAAAGNGTANGQQQQQQQQQQPPLGSEKLNAYHMFRPHKITEYIVSRFKIERLVVNELAARSPVQQDAAQHPDKWIELLCQGQVIPRNMTLGTIRTRIWRSGGDMVIKYRRRAGAQLQSAAEPAPAPAPAPANGS